MLSTAVDGCPCSDSSSSSEDASTSFKIARLLGVFVGFWEGALAHEVGDHEISSVVDATVGKVCSPTVADASSLRIF